MRRHAQTEQKWSCVVARGLVLRCVIGVCLLPGQKVKVPSFLVFTIVLFTMNIVESSKILNALEVLSRVSLENCVRLMPNSDSYTLWN